MSDEFPPPSGPPVQDEPSLPDPDENGYGYYAVEEYSGDPAVRALADQRSTPPTDRPPAAALEGERAPSRRPFDQPTESLGRRTFDPLVDDEHEEAEPDELLFARPGRMRFAERNWRIPLIGVLIAAMVVLITAILLLPDAGLEQEASSDVVDLREKPVKQWDEDLDGFAAGIAADDTSLYVVVVKKTVTELVAFDFNSGGQRWATELGSAGPAATGSVSVVDDGLAVVFTGSGAGGSFAMVNPADGRISWQGTADHLASTVVSDSVISSMNADGSFELSAIDLSNKRVRESVHADDFFIIANTVYLDNDGVLATADTATLQPSEGFRYRHGEPIVGPLLVGDDVVFGVGERLVRTAGDGTEKYSFDPQVGIIRDVIPMIGDRVLVSGVTRMRVVALNEGDAEALTSVRSGVSPMLIQNIEGDEFIVVFDGADRGVGPATVRILRVVDEDFDQVSEIELVSADGAPPITVTGGTAYTISFGTAPQFVAFDLNTGERLWSLALMPNDETMVTSNGVIVLTREDDESVVAFHAKGAS